MNTFTRLVHRAVHAIVVHNMPVLGAPMEAVKVFRFIEFEVGVRLVQETIDVVLGTPRMRLTVE